jgi:hypothetical protein
MIEHFFSLADVMAQRFPAKGIVGGYFCEHLSRFWLYSRDNQ